jgi:hypothetical protein
MDTADQLLVLAHSIATYASIVEQLDDLADLQAPVPHGMQRDARSKLNQLAQLWWVDVHGDPVWSDAHLTQTIEEAYDWMSSRSMRLIELREGNKTSGNN